MPQVKAASPATATTVPCRRRVAGDGHAEGRGESRAGVARAVAIVLAFGAQHEAVQAAGLADGVEAIEAAGQNLVNVGLMADVEEEAVGRGIEDGVQREGEFDDAEVRAEVAAGVGEGLNQEGADFLGQIRHLVGLSRLRSAGD